MYAGPASQALVETEKSLIAGHVAQLSCQTKGIDLFILGCIEMRPPLPLEESVGSVSSRDRVQYTIVRSTVSDHEFCFLFGISPDTTVPHTITDVVRSVTSTVMVHQRSARLLSLLFLKYMANLRLLYSLE
jgi:hypothetical protein